MLKFKKKGFTIVELVIVIAVIAILAAVLIPTFASVIKNAEQSTALQACKSASTEYLSEQMQANPGKTAKDILGKDYFAYDMDNDSSNGITPGSYKFRFDSNGTVLAPQSGNETIPDDVDQSTWTHLGSGVYYKPAS